MSINVNDKNLGHATAYAYYKAGGGTMTEAEFTEFMADFGTASQTAVEAAQAALASKNAAQTAATTATNKASEATTAAQTATTKAGEASTSASTATSAKDTAVSASQTATTKATEATTAAATATSAATTATTAKDDAVSAKTAAQTAQTGAETAAASVEASAEQIATNAADISQLKSDLTHKADGEMWGENLLDLDNLTDGKFINKSGSMGSSSSYAVTDYIPVKKDDVLRGSVSGTTSLGFRYVTAYNSSKSAVSASSAENVEVYTVPENISYVRITGYSRTDGMGINSDTARIFKNQTSMNYQNFYDGSTLDLIRACNTFRNDLNYYTLTTLPSYILNNLAYKPLGVLSKGYVCFVSDDGDAELATYTIPMFASKGVPGTWAVMSASTVFGTQPGIDAVLESVSDNGCQIAQHGGINWTRYNEFTLNKFFDDELEYFTSIGLTPYGAVCPEHGINDMVCAVAGGRFGCVRTGYDNAKVVYGDYCNGARSNLFGLTSQSIVDSTLASQCNILDDVKTNHYLRILHFHENELGTAGKAQLEGIIDYALSIGLEFITLKDIPSIV